MPGYSYPKEIREKARDRWVSGEASISQIARDLGVQRNTLLRWRTEDEWDGLRNEAEHLAHVKEVETLASKRETFQNNCLQMWAFLHAQCFQRAKQYTDLHLVMPTEEMERMAKVLLACQTGFYMALGIDPKIEARFAEDTRPRRVLVEYDPAGVFADVGEPNWHSTNGNGNGHEEENGAEAPSE